MQLDELQVHRGVRLAQPSRRRTARRHRSPDPADEVPAGGPPQEKRSAAAMERRPVHQGRQGAPEGALLGRRLCASVVQL